MMRARRRLFSLALLVCTGFLCICFLNLGLLMKRLESHFDHQSTSLDSLSDFVTTKKNRNTHSHRLPQPNPRPPLDSIVHSRFNITGDVSWLLDFSIVGFPKCGTSSLMYLFQSHPEIQIFSHERCEMGANHQARIINDLYKDFPAGDEYVRGIKCPGDLENTQISMPAYQKYFPQTDFFVGVR
jgi:hypothetical protein